MAEGSSRRQDSEQKIAIGVCYCQKADGADVGVSSPGSVKRVHRERNVSGMIFLKRSESRDSLVTFRM